MASFNKIEIVDSNNYKLGEQYKHLSIPIGIDAPELEQLKGYVLKNSELLQYKDPEVIFRTMEWVSMQWKHDGYNTPPEGATSYQILQDVRKGARYRCVEYGKVTADILLSFGYISRPLGILSSDVAYGPGGMGHAVTEAWSNELDKWIFLDPQFCISCKYQGEFLNFYEMYQLKVQNKFDEIEFVIPDAYLAANGLDKNTYIGEYKDFISGYFGFEAIFCMVDNRRTSLRMALEGKGQPLTFQGMPTINCAYTEHVEDLYYAINHTQVIFEFKDRDSSYNKMMELNLRTVESYTENIHIFAATPEFTLYLYNNMIWFDYFEVSFDEEDWRRIDGNHIDINLIEGVNVIRARAVNKAGVAGVPVYIKIKYGI